MNIRWNRLTSIILLILYLSITYIIFDWIIPVMDYNGNILIANNRPAYFIFHKINVILAIIVFSFVMILVINGIYEFLKWITEPKTEVQHIEPDLQIEPQQIEEELLIKITNRFDIMDI